MNPTEAKFNDDLDSIADQLDLGVRSGKFSWAEVQQRLKSKTNEVTSSADRYAHEHTWTSVGVAAGLGVMIGLLISRK